MLDELGALPVAVLERAYDPTGAAAGRRGMSGPVTTPLARFPRELPGAPLGR